MHIKYICIYAYTKIDVGQGAWVGYRRGVGALSLALLGQ